jgi:hypothetical protein
MKTLYRENESLTDEAVELGMEISDILEPTITKWVERGYTYREVCAITKDYLDIIRSVGIIKNYTEEEK